ncbi:hypothetical protein OsI_08445 [Oryza sativa Indica Group]|uniref:RING-type E3 ubiquitin transferase n=1 Tax=Oryza sativa subsp. indica TaxID=39946 RepID=B8AGG1_ORYSI|nr:hypothetical protein OsI_08445 [Oryza sativa Indica Group]
MATPRSPSPRGDARLDSAPLLGGGGGGGGRRHGGALRRPSLRGAARFLRRSGRRAMRGASLLLSLGDLEQVPFIAKHLESANTMFSFIWWIIGFYWVSAGGQVLTHDAPQLYWLCIVFLAFDVFFVVFCVALACIIGIAVCCCLPCIIAILYAVSDQEGASEDDIRQIPRYKFRRMDEPEKQSVNMTGSSGGIMIECGTNQPIEKVLAAEDAV